MCPRCGELLKDSRYLSDQQYKSCPQCSRRQGVHAYYAYGYFGMRTVADGLQIVQSWCPACRSGRVTESQMLCP